MNPGQLLARRFLGMPFWCQAKVLSEVLGEPYADHNSDTHKGALERIVAAGKLEEFRGAVNELSAGRTCSLCGCQLRGRPKECTVSWCDSNKDKNE